MPVCVAHALLLSSIAFRSMGVGVAASVRVVVPMVTKRNMNMRSIVVRRVRRHAMRVRTRCPLGSEKTC
ncbi:hypothetical protein I41_27440 [Lacipirellula limnantheis]|uniref:Secreted protein n=1 Tax=Lacipirellula limnantheis TaxID=2528024 RepID=A0A517TYX2_9BACT|nr:hypothetical protein I41_27440 [Lacipirellula limnantheis]